MSFSSFWKPIGRRSIMFLLRTKHAWRWLRGWNLIRKEMLTPGHHVAIGGPRLACGIIRIGLARIDVGITVFGKINHGEILHLLLMGCRTCQVRLKQCVSLFPGQLQARKEALQPAPFSDKALRFLSRYNSTIQKPFEHVRMLCRISVGLTEMVSTPAHHHRHILNGESRCKEVETDIHVPTIALLFEFFPFLTPFFPC